MSGDISADIVGACECRHRAPSCAYCGGRLGFDGPPRKLPCRACVASIAAESMTLDQLVAYCVDAGQSPEQAEVTALQMLAVASGALPHSPEALAIAAGVRREWMTRYGYDDAEIAESLLHSPPTSVEAERVELAAVASLEAMDAIGDDGELILVDDEPPTEVLNRADVVAALAEPSWRLALTDCVNLLKSIADRDPSAAAGYAMRFRELLTKAEQFGS